MMKRSPVLRNAPSINFDDAKPAISNAEPSVSAPAVSQLASRVSGMKATQSYYLFVEGTLLLRLK